jgi:cell division protein FtsB
VQTDPIFIPRIRIGNWAVRYASWGLSGKALAVFLLLLVLGSLVSSFYLNQASNTAAAGLEIAKLTREREYWRQENAHLRKQIANMESSDRLRSRAEELGFVEPGSVEYLPVECPRTDNTDIRTVPQSPWAELTFVPPSPTESADWWGDVVAHFQSWMNIQR